MSGVCVRCKRSIDSVGSGDLTDGYCRQADSLGECSLTENQQLLVKGCLCEECYESI